MTMQSIDIIVRVCVDMDLWIFNQEQHEKRINAYIEEGCVEAFAEVIGGRHVKAEVLALEYEDLC